MKNKKKYIDNKILQFHTIGLILAPVISMIKDKIFDFRTTILLLILIQIWIFIFFSLPLIVHYFNYKKFNNEIHFKIDLKSNKLLFTNGVEVFIDDIKRIYKVSSYNKSFIHDGFMDLYYFEIIDKFNKSYIVTCLVEEHLDKYVHKDKIVHISKFFPYIKYSQHFEEEEMD